ncbi:GTP 3',8-cyclase MoaA [Acinetobacter indicus]|uniref:GTP 3',8-cyclase MoaA n=1 Tax=Acinetobacter indicus TaxID=756892 RepID=UPI00144013A7|nr:GTP 3',8-cyclase MoaA [Acinetobacter indicus]MDM1290678.1 GTP 3',8-cyclase MoaA [Acinetobacter indicus]MDM1320784.1 GTP 3',8-cyclase MoaA [Acinetobacter indicus]MDM1332504.1 GTP 3',8-cyclase MoaA [Acinetobacter indicus]QIZ60320.1 GTP 3',8-cyclase MoaA [Acinetobacter indicus]
MINPQIPVRPAYFQDQFGRSKRKLRISVTDRCNFKCVYCMPEHPEWMKKHQLLSFEALLQFCQLMVEQGIQHIRITGGEPLMRQGVVHFIRDLQPLRQLGLARISMTTNGHYLSRYAQELKQAGLDDLNISLDSLDPQQFFTLTQKQLQPVLDGIQAAQQAHLPIKLNSVLIKGINDDQMVPLLQWSKARQIALRFIEFMPLDGDGHWSAAHVVTEQEILQRLSQHFPVDAIHSQGANPAREYRVDGHPVGIISTISHAFCGQCDRLRLSAQGELYNCLFAEQPVPLKALIEQLQTHTAPVAREQLLQQLQSYIWQKKAGFHAIHSQATTTAGSARKISMYMIGG